MLELIPPLFVAVIFYAVLPLSGAFMVRRRWRMFRKQAVEASLCREITYSDPVRVTSGDAGSYSFTGELQAIQDDSSIWLNNGKVTVRAEMKGIKLYLLPTTQSIENEGRIEENKLVLPQEMPKKIKWESVYSLAQGTGFLLSGKVFIENGTPVFRNTEDFPLLAVIYDGRKETILRRSIWSGRQLNEYWNSITPFSLMAGSFSLFVLTFIYYRQQNADFLALETLILSFFPLIPFVPPGLLMYMFFRRFWRSGRYLRGERDLLRLPLRFPRFSEYSSCREAMEEHPDARIRSCGIIQEEDLFELECRVYIASEENAAGLPKHFLENLIIPGDPEILAGKCRSRARWMEILAAASISFGFVLNLILFYLFLMWFL